MTSENILSKTISLARFPMMLLIVLIHSDIMDRFPADAMTPVAADVIFALSHTVARVAVPLFFFMSGFLFFYKKAPEARGFFSGQLRRRVRTLLVPYLLWNLIAQMLSALKNRALPSVSDFVNGFGPFSLVPSHGMLGVYDPSGVPADMPLWFLRDLMAIMLLTPLIYRVLKSRAGVPFCGVLVLLFFFGVWPDACFWFSLTGVSFFCFGAAFAIRRRDPLILSGAAARAIFVLFAVAVTLRVIFPDGQAGARLLAVVIMCGVPAMLSTCAALLARRGVEPAAFIAKSTFFMYAFHLIVAPTVKGAVVAAIAPVSTAGFIASYFLGFAGIVGVSLAVYYVGALLFPRFVAVLCGGR